MTLAPQSLRSMGDELTKLALPTERLTPARRKQMWKDAPVVIGSMGLGWGVGKTLTNLIGDQAIKDPRTLAAVRKYTPTALALTGTGIGLALTRQRHIMKKRRNQAERKAKAKRDRKFA